MSATVPLAGTLHIAPVPGAVLYVDEDQWHYHLTLDRGVRPKAVRSALQAAQALGLAPLEEGEGDPYFLDDGRIRMDLARVFNFEGAA
ncbi:MULTISPECIES: hypothetical protein [Streptomyces]|uniref:hypothetical protein n=1 Tax=Streptomyces TaxID=1883 RepID=UPI002E28CC1C|nr:MULTISPECIES: hypothetical protein [Streptomyces]